MQITRKMTFGMFENDWCPVCGEVTKTERITTGLPGILAQNVQNVEIIFKQIISKVKMIY